MMKNCLWDLIIENIPNKVRFGVFGPGTLPAILQVYVSSKNKAFGQ